MASGLITRFLGEGTAAARPADPDVGSAIAFYWSTDTNEMSAWLENAWVEDVLGTGGALLIANNLSDVANVTTAQQNLNLEPGVDVQAFDDLLADIAGFTLTGEAGNAVVVNGTEDGLELGTVSGGTPSGTSFPGSPATDDKFYRTDRRIEYFYDGTRWLSTQIHLLPIPFALAAAPASDQSFYSAIPFKGQYDIYLERFDISGWRSAAGEWDFLLQHGTGSPGTYTTIATVDGSGHPTTTWFAGNASVNAVLTSSCEVLRLTLDEVSGTATLLGAATVSFRLVG